MARRRVWTFEQLEPRELLASDLPNIIVINTDDQRFDSIAFMPTLQAELLPDSAVFTNSFVTTPVCSPSRASLLTGLYANNHGVLHVTEQLGNFANFNDTSTLATWLDDAGYNTALVGKYINGYDQNAFANLDPNDTYVAPGWDVWRAMMGATFNSPTISFDGVNQSFPQAYTTDVLNDIAEDFILTNSPTDDEPFFLYYVPHNPHEPSLVAPRHVGFYDDIAPHRPPSFNEADISDKPQWVKNQLPLLNAAGIAAVDQFRQDQLESMLSVDEGIGIMIDALQATGELENTIIIFTSDNGQHWGEHRFDEKGPAWEESIRVPLLIYDGRNPTSQAIDEMALNIDLAPTIMQLAGLALPQPVDGESLVPLLNNEPTAWRDEFLIERYAGDGGKYYSIRTEQYVYTEYVQTNGFELYDLVNDPYQLTSQHNNPAYATVKANLAARLAQLRPSDTTGPLLSNAAYSVGPGGVVTVTVTSSDASTGGSEVRNTEYFIDAPGTTQQGAVMRAADGTYNSVTENMVVELPTLSDGTHTLYIHGRDIMGNWGPMVTLQVEVGGDPPGGGQVLYRINAGGAQQSGDPVWSADTTASPSTFSNFDEGGNSATSTTTATINMSHASIPAGTPMALFQSERFDKPTGANLLWDFPVTPGEYEVRLYFAETYSGAFATGARVFDVTIEGTTVLDNYDVFADVGGLAGVVKSFTVTSNANLDIDFLRVVQNPAIKAIEILTVGQPQTSPLNASVSAVNFGSVEIGESATQQITLTNGGQAGDSSITINPAQAAIIPGGSPFSFNFGQTAPIVLAPGQSTVVSVTYTPTAASAANADFTISHNGANSPLSIDLSGSGVAAQSTIIYRINAGGAQQSGDPVWSADTTASPSTFSNFDEGGNSATSSTTATINMSHASIPAGTPMALFQTERFDNAGGANLLWDFPVTPGEYEVRLYFAETWSGAFATGVRVFDVAIEGTTLLDNYDVFADVGSLAGVVKSFTVTSDANLDIDFLRVVQNPAIKAIEILAVDGPPNNTISFSKSVLGNTTGLDRPTSLQFGPDGRLYVSQQNGLIRAYTIVRNGANDYDVVAQETITLIQQIPNHNDDGTLNANVNTRLVTGLLVTGTAQNPVLYVTSSDPRIGGGSSGVDLNLDTNSSMVSRLTWNGTSWQKQDLVRGLPRSEENHATNGMQLDSATNTLYVAIGGHTNMGAPSNNFSLLPEYALSAAILAIDLDAIGATTYDLPTLNDETRAGVNDAGDPFGGNDGKNQAKLVPGGPVQVYAPGFRNPYDLLITSSGRMYTVDNGPNAGWGSVPIGEGPGGNATNQVSEPGVTFGDSLHFITGAGYYGGHPNPTRSNTNNTFNPTIPQSPVSVGNPVESDYRVPGVENGGLVVFGDSTNGITEYTSNTFGGAMQGDLIIASFDNTIKRVKLNAAGNQVVLSEDLFSNVGFRPLDVTAPATGPFAGSIWVVDVALGTVTVFEPASGTGGDPDDLDGDGYSNNDEIANGTDPNSAADVPPDYDADFTSNLLDPNDDNDTLADEDDPFAVDASNGSNTAVGVVFDWENEGENLGGILGMGFTGLMSNGVDNYESLFDPQAVTAGGAAGVFTIDSATTGTAHGAANTQQQAFQFGVNVTNETAPFTVKTSVLGPFSGLVPQAGQEMGFFIGTGDQDNYVQLVLSGDGGGSVKVMREIGGVFSLLASQNLALPGPGFVELHLVVDPTANTVQARYSVDGAAFINLGGAIAIPSAWLASSLAVGLISTNPSGTPMPVTWDFLGVERDAPVAGTAATVEIFSNGNISNSSTYNSGSIHVLNTATGGQQIHTVTIDLSTGFLPDVLFDPAGTAGDPVGKTITPNSGSAETGFVGFTFLGARDGGFDAVQLNFTDFNPGEVFTFSVDIDPTSVKGAPQPGPEQAASVSGLELSGATVTVEFSNGAVLTGDTFAVAGSVVNSKIALTDDPISSAPTVQLLGVSSTPTIVQSATQTVRITGPTGATVRLLRAEAALMLAGVPGGGYDLDPFEANKVIVVQQQTVTIGPLGFVDVPVTLTDSHVQGGINYLMAVIQEPDGRTSELSNVIVVALGGLPPGSNPGAGEEGLVGEYFNATNLTGSAGTRVDPVVNFPQDWGSAPAGTAVTPDDNYSVRWSGFVETSTAGNWTFYTTSNDGVRLWVDDVLVINNWTQHAVVQNSATVSLAAGWHPIQLEYFQQGGVAEITLSYQGPGQTKTIIPQSKLRTAEPGGTFSLAVAPLPGDYNNNDLVDQTDYDVWRQSFGSIGVGLAADGNGDGAVDAADYVVWKKYVGSSRLTPIGTTVTTISQAAVISAEPVSAISGPSPAIIANIVSVPADSRVETNDTAIRPFLASPFRPISPVARSLTGSLRPNTIQAGSAEARSRALELLAVAKTHHDIPADRAETTVTDIDNDTSPPDERNPDDLAWEVAFESFKAEF